MEAHEEMKEAQMKEPDKLREDRTEMDVAWNVISLISQNVFGYKLAEKVSQAT